VRPDPVRSKCEPFAAIPHAACVSDLSDAAYRVLGAVIFFARRGSCDATDRQLGHRCGKSVPAIQRGLRELEAKGWIERLAGARRVIRLRSPACSEGISSPLGSEQAPDRERSGTCSEGISHPLGSEQASDHRRSPLEKGEDDRNVVPSDAPVRPLLDELKALPGADVPKVRSVAWRLAHHLTDVASVAFFTLVLGLVAKGSAPLQRLLDAFRVADRCRGSVRKPGAIFAATWSGWTPPPKPSEINRPTSRRAPATLPRPKPPPPDGTGDELAELERLVAAGGPVARMARARLAELRAGVAAEGRPAAAAPRA